eukprot:462456-Prymnesium_polylepis.1
MRVYWNVGTGEISAVFVGVPDVAFEGAIKVAGCGCAPLAPLVRHSLLRVRAARHRTAHRTPPHRTPHATARHRTTPHRTLHAAAAARAWLPPQRSERTRPVRAPASAQPSFTRVRCWQSLRRYSQVDDSSEAKAFTAPFTGPVGTQ